MADRRDHIEGILECFHVTKQRLLAGMHTLSDQVQISGSQWMALHAIYHHEGIGIKELSRILGISSSASTQLVDNLVKKGTLLCQKDPDDRRALNIKLAKNTREQIEKARTQALEKIYAFFDVLSDEELKQFNNLSKKVANFILENQEK